MEKDALNKVLAQQLRDEQLKMDDFELRPAGMIPHDLAEQAEVKNFQAALSAEAPVEIQPLDKATNAATLDNLPVRSPGDEILMGLHRVSETQGSNVQIINDEITRLSHSDGITMADTLKLQKLVLDYQIIHDLISKGTDKLIQGAQTLFRNQ